MSKGKQKKKKKKKKKTEKKMEYENETARHCERLQSISFPLWLNQLHSQHYLKKFEYKSFLPHFSFIQLYTHLNLDFNFNEKEKERKREKELQSYFSVNVHNCKLKWPTN